MGSRSYHAGLLGSFCPAFHPFCSIPLSFEKPAQERRMAQFCQSRTRIFGTGSRPEIPQCCGPNLPLGHPRSRNLSGFVDRYLLFVRSIPTGQDPIRTRQRHTKNWSSEASVGDHYLCFCDLHASWHVGCTTERIIRLFATTAHTRLRTRS